ncbi:MAG: GNAT family N-acetyltransferase [Sphaerochaeta sp.]|nr:GNAT family N-acetyltransferase [Sphaerochaeta sp.]
MRVDEIELKAKDGRTVSLRSLEGRDGEAVIAHMERIYATCPYMSRYTDEWSAGVEDERLYLQRVHQSESRLFVGAFWKGRLIAIADFCPPSALSKMAHRCSCSIAIDPAFQGIGIGWAMMRLLITEARRVGYEQMELEVVGENEAAVALYTKLGFVEWGRLRHGFKNRDGSYHDLLSMVLTL